MLAEVAAGLAAPQKELPPKYFYDQRGSELFEEITRLPEYYPTRTERALLLEWMPRLMLELGTRTLVELGAGSAEKRRIILSAMRAAGTADLYVPIDVSASFLTQTAAPASPRVSWSDSRAAGGRHRRGIQPASVASASRPLRISGRHHRQLLSAGGDPAAEPGSRAR